MNRLKIDNNYFFETGDHQYTVFHNGSLKIFKYKGKPENFPYKNDRDDTNTVSGISRTGEWLKDVLLSVTVCVSEDCNLACKYCYADGGSYHRAGKTVMSFQDLKYMFEGLLIIYPKGIVNYTFFGGEPMLGFRQIESFVQYVTEEARKRNLIAPHFAIVTNGTLITERAWRMFHDYQFSVTVSLDGPKSINDQMRVYPVGQKSVYDTVKGNITRFGKRSFLLVAEATLSDAYFRNYSSGSAKEYLDSFYSLGFDTVFPFVAEMKDIACNDKDFVHGLTCFYYDLADYYMDLLLDPELFEGTPSNILGIVIDLLRKKSKKSCSAGKGSLFYTCSGDLYPCQMYYGNDAEKIGTIRNVKELKVSMDGRTQVTKDNIPECKDCFAYRFCNMWCPGGSYLFAGAENRIDPVRCVVQKAIGERIICRLADIYESDQKQNFINHIISLSSRYSFSKFIGKVT
ncbi:MAG: radical SAM protein [Clostridium sp.]|nr:radical SAM protein [Clostridium sp.]